ncbi:MAG: GerMN domain-containing protein [Candidatus Hydrogenedentes bacterium]|nr:GerMN domain-containing protein [Candidatus Hydrogenedentota bacterium]
MAENREPTFSRKLFLAVWAMATLILLFTVILLTSELIRLGRNPLTLPEVLPEPMKPVTESPSAKESREVVLYFASADARQLAGDSRRLPYVDHTVDNCRTALEALLDGPVTSLQSVIPSTVEVRGMWLMDNGELIVDFTYPLQTDSRKSVSEEALFVYSVVNTLTQSALQGSDKAVVQSVRFLIDGQPPTNLYPAHLNLAGPVYPDSDWLADAGGGQPDDA